MHEFQITRKQVQVILARSSIIQAHREMTRPLQKTVMQIAQTLRSEHAKASEGSLRQRHLKMLLTNMEETQKAFDQDHTESSPAYRRAMLVDLGIADQSEVSQFVTDPNEPLPASSTVYGRLSRGDSG